MRFLLSLLMFFCITKLYAQSIPPPVEWQHCYGGSLADYGYGISATSDGGFIFAGCAGSSDGNILKSSDDRHGGTCDYWGAKIASDSTIQFKVHKGGTASDVAHTALETLDGNYIMGGGASSSDVDISDHHGGISNTYPDFWIVKVNSSNAVLWKKSYGGTSYDDFGSMILTPDGGYALCGGTESNDGDVSGGHGSMDFWLVKIDASGNIQWQKCYGGSGYEKAFDIKLCNDGGYIMAGSTTSQDGDVTGCHSLDVDGWVVKTDANGNIQWQKCVGGTGQDALNKVIQLQDENFLVAGYEFSIDGDISNHHNNDSIQDGWLTLLDHNGNLIWSKAYGGDNTDAFESLVQDYLGGIYVCGYSLSINGDLSTNYGNNDGWLASINENGDILWDSTYGGPYNDVFFDLAIANDNRMAIIGYTTSDSIDVYGNHGMDTSVHPLYQSQADYWVLDLGSVVGIHEIPKSILNVLPSLAHDVVQISSNDLENEKTFVTVRNESGQVIMHEVMDHESQLLLNISFLGQGIYFIEARNEKLNAVSKFVKI